MTASQPDALPLVPHYGTRTLADLLPSIGFHLGLGGSDRLGIGPGERWVVLLIDGLGTEQLEQFASRAPFLAGELRRGQTITSGVPSTTVTSLASLGTGLPPGGHGVAGFTCLLPETDEIVNPLFWNSTYPPRAFQDRQTEFERFAASGVTVTSVLPAKFANSALTIAALRGGSYAALSDDDPARHIEATVAASTQGPRTLTYTYVSDLDHRGHVFGWQSPEWLECLVGLDRWASWLRAELADDVRLVITADHGMVDVPAERRLVVEPGAELLAGVRFLAGEPRLRQLYCDDGVRPAEVADRWADELGDRAWVRTRGQACAEGWFGEIDPRLAGRFGDVVAAATSDWAVLTPAMPGEFELVGMHGSLTPAEMLVPLLVS